jgi:hypothetical protein
MYEKQSQFDWTFGFWWFVTCAIGTAIGGMAAFATMWTVGDAVAESVNEPAGWLVGGALFGLLLGLGANLGPGVLLNSKGINPRSWILGSAVAAATILSVTLLIMSSATNAGEASEAVVTLVLGLTLGLPMGLIQFLMLRRSGPAAGAWPLISVVAYLLAAGVVAFWPEDDFMVLPLIMMGLLVAAVTALGIVWQGRRPLITA